MARAKKTHGPLFGDLVTLWRCKFSLGILFENHLLMERILSFNMVRFFASSFSERLQKSSPRVIVQNSRDIDPTIRIVFLHGGCHECASMTFLPLSSLDYFLAKQVSLRVERELQEPMQCRIGRTHIKLVQVVLVVAEIVVIRTSACWSQRRRGCSSRGIQFFVPEPMTQASSPIRQSQHQQGLR
jgi:hypothetical protein